MNIIFGPIKSRRFGVSLGVDLSPFKKQCNFDCLYCELEGSKTITKQDEVVDVNEIIEELKKHLNPSIDVITLTANGEPTLYPYLDKLIDEIDKIKQNTKTLILTNSATLDDKKVYKTLLKLDCVKLSLDAISPEVFKKIDRPNKELDITKIPQNIINFSRDFKGELYIEILFVKNINDKKEEIQKLNDILNKLENITRIDIGTIDRPPAYNVKALTYEQLFEISKKFSPTLPIFITSHNKQKKLNFNYSEKEIITTLQKRPLTKDDIDELFNENTKKRLQNLIKLNKIIQIKEGSREYYKVNNKEEKEY